MTTTMYPRFQAKRKLITKRETEVLSLIVDEYTTKEIASQLYISYQTASTHRKNLLAKLDVKNSAGLVRKAFELGIVQLPFTLIGTGNLALSL